MNAPEQHNLDAEKALLSCAIQDAGLVMPHGQENSVGAILSNRHALIWRAIESLMERKAEVDLVSVAQKLTGSGHMQAVGLDYLSEVADTSPTPHNWQMHLDDVTATYARRRMWEVYTNAAMDLCNIATPLDKPIAAVEAATIDVRDMTTVNPVKTFKGLLQDVLEELRLEHAGRQAGIPFGIEALDNLTGGMRPGDMIVVAARPGMGKSAMAMQVALHVGQMGGNVLIFSLEMSDLQTARRSFGIVGGVDTRRFGRKEADSRDFKATQTTVARLKDVTITIDDKGGVGIGYVRARASTLNRKRPLSLVVVDYVQLMKGDSGRGSNRETEIAGISNGLKALAKELGCPVMALCQLNRQADKERPRLSHLRESGAIEQDADVAIAISQCASDDVSGADSSPAPGDPISVVVDVLKQRGGPTGECKMIFEPRFTRFVPAWDSKVETTH